MKLKGKMVMELTDVNTSEVETIVEENMVTNAVNNILGLNPMAVFYCEEEYSTGLVWTGNLLPICPNMIGGILLFPKALEENADNIYVKSDNLPVAYASNNVNSTANTARGSLNLTESKVLDNGYKFVWEFTPSQGNGTIAAIALTSAKGGENGFGSSVADASTFLQLKEVDIGTLAMAKQMVLFETVEVDFENDILYSITFENSSVRVRKVRIPIFSIGLNEKINDSTYTVVEDKVIPASVFQFMGSYTLYGEFLDGQDGYWYGFSNEENSSGAVKCRARAEEKMKLARLEFKMPPLLTDAEIEEVLNVLPDLTKWANEITAYASEAAIHHGKEWNGFKVVEGRSNRKYRDELLVAEAAREHGYTDIYRQTLIPMTEMQKLMGKSTFEEILGDLIYKPPGKPTLVPNTDKRPAMNVTNAENEFDKIMED